MKLKTAFKYIVGIVLMVLFLYFAFDDTDFGHLWYILSHANYWWALAMFPVLLLSHMVRAWRWEYLLRPVKKELRYRNLFSAMMVGYMMNNVLPRAGELVRPYAIGKLEGVSRTTAFGTVLIERMFDIFSFMIVIALIPFAYTGPLTQVFPWLEDVGIWITLITISLLGIFSFLMFRRDIVMKFLNYFTRHASLRTAKFAEHITHSFLDGFLFIKEPRNYFLIALLSAIIWILYIIMMYLPFYAFNLTERYSLDLGSAIVVQAISSIGYLMPTPGAIGPYHYFTIQTLTKLYGVNEDVARSYATITHAIGYIGITVIGLYYFLRDKLHMTEVMKQESSKQDVVAEPDRAS
ncbi:MAG TPA: lysylphosphatidylglycerol synthase transmembrane domain-containing protein [Bacteroidota bacterium]|nr:lysylphosphatidylglycerol synthase transmembrane domain-containing protein [Bacteroidota bacterium]